MPDLQQPGPDRSAQDEGPVPEENLPGHHPDEEQDKPDPADFVAKAKEVAARKGGARKAATPSTAGSKRPAAADSTASSEAPQERGGEGATPSEATVASHPSPTATGGEADAPTATPEAVVAQAAVTPSAPPPAAAPTSAPTPGAEQAATPAQNPVAAVLAFQWRVATFPIRVAGDVLERLRRLR